MSATATMPRSVERPANAGLRTLLTRNYLGYSQPASLADRWLAPPTTAVTVIVNAGDPFGGLPRAFVAGMTDRTGIVAMDGAIECVELKLSPLGAYRLLGTGMHELTGRVVDVEDVLGAAGRRLAARIAEATDWPGRFAPLDGFLLDRAETGRAPAGQVCWVWRRLTESSGRVPISVLAREVGWSRRHLVTRFRQQVGLAPKTVARMLRFELLLRRIGAAGTAGLAGLSDTATECGYYDQSHMNRDFREFAGTTPGDYLSRLTRSDQVTSVQYPWVPA